MEASSIIHVRVKPDVKERAMKNAEAVGIPLASLVNAFVTKFAAEGRLPFEIKVPEMPNDDTLEAVKEYREAKGKRKNYDSLDDMYAAMDIDRKCGR